MRLINFVLFWNKIEYCTLTILYFTSVVHDVRIVQYRVHYIVVPAVLFKSLQNSFSVGRRTVHTIYPTKWFDSPVCHDLEYVADEHEELPFPR